VFLESDVMRRSMTSREIVLEEKRDYAPVPIIQKPPFPDHVEVAPPVERTINATQIPMTSSDVIPDDTPIEDAQKPSMGIEVPNYAPLRRSKAG
jgi:hypothetical protein